jgi:hypothetical protein
VEAVRAYLDAAERDAPEARARALATAPADADWPSLVGAALRRPIPSTDAQRRISAARLGLSLGVPTSYTPERAWPIVIGLHPAVQRTDAAEQFCASSVLDAYRETAVVVCPLLSDEAWDSPAGARRVAETLDWTARHLHVDPDGVILTGYSLGGHGVWYLAGLMADRLAVAVPLAGAPRHPEQLPNARHLPLFAVNADHDRVVDPLAGAELAASLRRGGYALTTILVHGNHFAIGQHVAGLEPHMDKIRRARRNPFPPALRWTGSRPQRHYWLEILEVEGPGVVEAAVDGRRIILETEGVDRLALLLSPELVDLATLAVLWNDEVAFRGPVPVDPGALLDHARRRPDGHALVFARLELTRPRSERLARAAPAPESH